MIAHIGVTAQGCAFQTPYIAALVLFSIAQIGVIAQGVRQNLGPNDSVRFPHRNRTLGIYRSLGTPLCEKNLRTK